ncbi:UNVERIFIED_CONTAM: hypothetical protein HDU68_009485 [Siphonaria sp. JEL0065]|nr:hypothetical protein HDU68_009485 [Siphonaria sp. JEL0065]
MDVGSGGTPSEDDPDRQPSPPPLSASIVNLGDWDIVNEQKHWRSVSYEERIPLPVKLPIPQPIAPIPQPIPAPSSHSAPSSTAATPIAVSQPEMQLPLHLPQATITPSPHIPVSICSFNTCLVAESEPGSMHSSNTRAERILDFCRSIHIVSLQEVWGPGVDVLTSGLSVTHSIPAGLRSTNIPVITNAVNTLAFYFTRTGGLWVAHSRVGAWGDGKSGEDLRISSSASTSLPVRAQPRYPPSKRPVPQLSLPPIPLTVPSLKSFSISPGGSSSNSRNAIRALLLDMSEAWGSGRRLLLFNLQLDAYDSVKRRLQLRETVQYIQEVVFSLTSLIPLNENAGSPTSPEETTLQKQSNSFRHCRSSSTPHASLRKSNPTASQHRPLQAASSTSSHQEEFDMIDEYASPPQMPPYSKQHGATSLPGSPSNFLSLLTSNSSFDSPLYGSTYPLQQSRLPSKLIPRLQNITKDTALLITGDFNLASTSPEYSQLSTLLGPQDRGGCIRDLFADFPVGESDTVAGDGRNRLVRAGSVLGRVDYMLNGISMALEGVGGGRLGFLEVEMVDGRVVRGEKGEEMSQHWPLVGLFRPKGV